MKNILLTLTAILLSISSICQTVLYDQSNLINGKNNDGQSVSYVDASLGLDKLGYRIYNANDNQMLHISDDFQTCDEWKIDSIKIYSFAKYGGFITNASLTQSVSLQILDGPPNSTNTKTIWTTDGRRPKLNSTYSKNYRVESINSEEKREIIETTIPTNAQVNGGRYWIRFSLIPENVIGGKKDQFVPPLTIKNSAETGNALYESSKGFYQFIFSGGEPQGIPFKIYGKVVKRHGLDAAISVTPDDGSTNGTASVTAIGGVAPYTYTWNTVPVQTTPMAVGLAAGNYRVTIKDSLGVSCQIIKNVAIPNNPVNVNSFIQDSISIYPNPIADVLKIKSQNSSNLILKIYNTEGAIVFEKKPFGNQISLKNLSPGIYSLTLTSNKIIKTFKIIKL